MSAKPPKKEAKHYNDCFTAWGLAAGEHAFYAESLGQFYFFLTGAFLDHLKRDDIEEVLVLNFHVGLKCAGEYPMLSNSQKVKKKKFSASLTNPDSKPKGLIQRISALHQKTGSFTLAVCSAAVIVECYTRATSEMQRFISRDYSHGQRLTSCKLEVAVMNRLARLADKEKNVKLRIFHTAADLPITALYLKFRSPIAPRLPGNGKKAPRDSREIMELLAIGLYEPRYATDVVQAKGDISLPVQILVAGNSLHDRPIQRQIRKLVDVYYKHIEQHTTNPPGQSIKLDTTTYVFIAHYSEDADLAQELRTRIEASAKAKKLRCKCILGVGPEMSWPEKSNLGNLNELSRLIDYAIVLYPQTETTRHNIPHELGLFSQRFMTSHRSQTEFPSRVIVVGKRSHIEKDLSNLSGIPIVDWPNERENDDEQSLFKTIVKKIPFLGA